MSDTNILRSDANIARAFLRRAAELLHRCGAPTDRIEVALRECAAGLGMHLQVLATPTAVELAFGRTRQRSVLIRGDAGSASLARLVALEQLLAAVGSGTLTLVAGRRRLHAIAMQAPLHGPLAQLLAHGLLAGSAAASLGGGVLDVLVSALLGLAIGLLGRVAHPLASLHAPLATFLAALLGQGLARVVPGLDGALIGLAGVIVLLPGLSLTLALGELATRHLVAGTARLAGAVMALLSMAFGVALAQRLLALDLLPAMIELDPRWTTPLPELARALASLLAPLGACVLFDARWRELPALGIASLAGMAAVSQGQPLLGPELAAFAGAIVVGLTSNAYARASGLPSAVVLLPGLLTLVPGSVGFRSMLAFLAGAPTAGIDAAFRTTLIAVSLVAGVLASNAMLPPELGSRRASVTS
jgi:uncharacterized membrane protein YjjP (DUF1212 family)